MFLEKLIAVRIHETQHKQIKELIKQHPDTFESDSHTIRCAINFFNNTIKKGGINAIRNKE